MNVLVEAIYQAMLRGAEPRLRTRIMREPVAVREVIRRGLSQAIASLRSTAPVQAPAAPLLQAPPKALTVRERWAEYVAQAIASLPPVKLTKAQQRRPLPPRLDSVAPSVPAFRETPHGGRRMRHPITRSSIWRKISPRTIPR